MGGKYANLKGRSANTFAARHKEPILGLRYIESVEDALDSLWLEVWDYIAENLNDSSDAGIPYIELSRFETKSGRIERFELDF